MPDILKGGEKGTVIARVETSAHVSRNERRQSVAYDKCCDNSSTPANRSFFVSDSGHGLGIGLFN